MIDASAVHALAERFSAPAKLEMEGRPRIFLPKDFKEADAYRHPTPVPLEVSTLTGFVEYLKSEVDLSASEAKYLIHVVSPTVVELVAALEEEALAFRRRKLVRATTTMVATPFEFGVFHEQEKTIIALQALFLPTPARDELLDVVSHIRESAVKTSNDSGAAQEVTAQVGVYLNASKVIPNPIELRPYRTFREVDQPTSKFVVRLKSGATPEAKPTLALFEADGGTWKLTAMENIRDWIATEMGAALRTPILA